MSRIVLIAAMDLGRAIGRSGKLPWQLPDDLKRFKELTLGKTVLMGRKTFESIGRPLPRRHNLVLSRDPNFSAAGVEVIGEFGLALYHDPLMVIGGGEIYTLALPRATHLYLTYVETAIEGADAFFPDFDPNEWNEVSRIFHPKDERHAFDFWHVDFERMPAGSRGNSTRPGG
jgi:dihydrofolate reductase